MGLNQDQGGGRACALPLHPSAQGRSGASLPPGRVLRSLPVARSHQGRVVGDCKSAKQV